MERSGALKLARREFLSSASFLFLGRTLLAESSFWPKPNQAVQELKEELTAEELKVVERSAMAQDLKNYFGKGFSCAESLWMVSLRFMEKPEDLIWIACGFGGGLQHKDLCGFLTSGAMAIGLSTGMLKKAREEGKEYCKQNVKDYWAWWTSLAPLHCSEIRKEGTSSRVCLRIGQLASARIEEMIKPAQTICS